MYARSTEGPVLLVGAAHVVDLAGPLRRLLSDRVLDGIAIELDPERAATLLAPEGSAARRGGGPLFARLWQVVQRRLGEEIGGGVPGAEMRAAAEVAKERRLPLFLVDDPIRLTLLHLVRAMPLRERVTLLASAVIGLFVPARVVEREMERYNAEPDAYAAELRRASPTLARVLLDDRNEHMAERLTEIRRRGYGRVAVVLGDAHLTGLGDALKRRGIPVESIRFRELVSAKGPAPSPS